MTKKQKMADILKGMKKLEGGIYTSKTVLDEMIEKEGATENSGNVTNKATNDLYAGDKWKTTTGAIAEGEEDEEVTVDETDDLDEGDELDESDELDENIPVKNATENSGNVTNKQGGGQVVKDFSTDKKPEPGKQGNKTSAQASSVYSEMVAKEKASENSGNTTNQQNGETQKDTWKLAADKARSIMQGMKSFNESFAIDDEIDDSIKEDEDEDKEKKN